MTATIGSARQVPDERYDQAMDLARMLEKLAGFPEQFISFYDEEGRIARKSYPDVKADVEQAIREIKGWGVKAGMRVGILATNCYEWVVYDVAADLPQVYPGSAPGRVRQQG